MDIFAKFPRPRGSANDQKQRRLPSLESHCRRGEFETILELLHDQNAPIESKWLEQDYTLMGENALHFIMRFQPPADVVSAMMERLQNAGTHQPEIAVDFLGRTPLHHACVSQCEPCVIHTLLRSPAGVISARAKDLQGRLPLHLLCKSYQPSRKRKIVAQAKDEMALSKITVGIKLLVGLSPRTACVKDDKGRIPLDYVKQMKVHTKNHPNAAEFWENMKTELSIAMDLSASASTTSYSNNFEKSGMVIRFSTETTPSDNDDVSVLSSSGV